MCIMHVINYSTQVKTSKIKNGARYTFKYVYICW